MRIWTGHASSHSDDYLQVATFGSEMDAKKAAKALKKWAREYSEKEDGGDWMFDECDISVGGSSVRFGVYTAGYGLDESANLLKKNGAIKIDDLMNPAKVEMAVKGKTREDVENRVNAINLLMDRVLDLRGYAAGSAVYYREDGGWVYALTGMTDEYATDDSGDVLESLHGVDVKELEELGCSVALNG